MKVWIIVLTLLLAERSFAQELASFNEKVSTQTRLELDFSFADEIMLEIWDKEEVLVEVSVSINQGENNNLFKLDKSVSPQTIRFDMDMEPFEDFGRQFHRSSNCNIQVDLFYKVYLPRNMAIDAETIDGNFTLSVENDEVKLKTISGDIDLTVGAGLEFSAKTISGEIYSDLDIDIPDNEGLRQIVGMDVNGRIGNGGKDYVLETISGNIYLRKAEGRL